MIAALVIAFVVAQSVHCRSLSSHPQSSDMIIELSNRNPVPLIRNARQSGNFSHCFLSPLIVILSFDVILGSDYNPYDMYPDTGKNPNTYPQQQQQSNNANGFPFAVNNFPTIFGKK